MQRRVNHSEGDHVAAEDVVVAEEEDVGVVVADAVVEGTTAQDREEGSTK